MVCYADRPSLFRAVEIIKGFLHRVVTSHVTVCEHRPLLAHFQSDLTPFVGRHYSEHVLDQLHRFRRSGKKKAAKRDYHVQRGFVLYADAARRANAALVAEEARCMEHKDCWTQFSAMTACSPLIRTRGHKGFVVQHYAWDRGGGFSKLVRLAHARSSYFYSTFPGDFDGERERMRAKDWTLVTPCTIHAAAKRIAWAMEPQVSSAKQDLNDIHIALSSVRQSWDVSCSLLPYVMNEKLDLVDHEDYRGDKAFRFWTALGVAGHIASECAEVGLLAVRGRFQCHGAALRAKPDWSDWLEQLIMSLFSFLSVSGSRWPTASQCGRALISGLAAGLALVMETLLDAKCASKYCMTRLPNTTTEIEKVVRDLCDGSTTRRVTRTRVHGGRPLGWAIGGCQGDVAGGCGW